MLQFSKNIYKFIVGRNSAVIFTAHAAIAMRQKIHDMKSTRPGFHFGAFRLKVNMMPLYTNHRPITIAVVIRRTHIVGSVVSWYAKFSTESVGDPHSVMCS